MKKLFILLLPLVALASATQAANRYWIHKVQYENQFSTSSQLAEWNLVEDNGTGGFTLSAGGTAILKMDNAAGNFANRIFSVDGSSPRLLPLDRISGRVEINIKYITGGNQRIFVSAQQFDTSNTYIGEISILPAQSNTGFFSIDLNTIAWPAQADKIRFIIGGENYSGQQGTMEFDYFSYSNGSNNWNNTANWSATSNGVAGASVPSAGDVAIFDGTGNSNSSCLFDQNVSVSSLQVYSSYAGNIDQQSYSLSVGAGGLSLQGGGLSCGSGSFLVDGNLAVSNAVLKASSGTMELHGSCAVTSTVFNANNGILRLNRTGNQQVSLSGNNAYSLTVDKPSGSVELLSDLLVSGTLSLANGIINTNGYAVTLGTGTANTGVLVNSGGRINGKLIRWFNNTATGSVVYPLGSSTTNAAFAINVGTAPSAGGAISVEYADHPPAFTTVNFTDGSTAITKLSSAYWNVGASLSGGSFSLGASNNNLATYSSVNDLHLVNANGVTGSHLAAGGTVGNPVINRSALTATNLSQSYYVGVAAQTLPLAWLGFTAQKQNNQLVVGWQTSQELRVDHFLIEVSPDGSRFTQRAVVASKGADSHQYQYTLSFLSNTKQAYIRIASVDVDGKTAYTPVQLLQDLQPVSFSVYPVSAQTQLTIQAAIDLTNSTLAIISVQGQLIRQVKLAGARYVLDVTTLPNGPYQLKLYDPEKKLLMEKPIMVSH